MDSRFRGNDDRFRLGPLRARLRLAPTMSRPYVSRPYNVQRARLRLAPTMSRPYNVQRARLRLAPTMSRPYNVQRARLRLAPTMSRPYVSRPYNVQRARLRLAPTMSRPYVSRPYNDRLRMIAQGFSPGLTESRSIPGTPISSVQSPQVRIGDQVPRSL
jgi:hypothetical protein